MDIFSYPNLKELFFTTATATLLIRGKSILGSIACLDQEGYTEKETKDSKAQTFKPSV
jgi:hypothetical protein